MYWIIQLIGFLALFAGVISFQFKSHKNIMICKSSSEFLFTVQYALLDAWTAVVLSLISVFRNLLFRKLVKENRSTKPAIMAFGVMVLATGVFTYDGFLTLLPIASKLLSTISYGMKQERRLRMIAIPSSVFWVIYNLAVGSIAGALTDSLTLVSIFVAIYKYDIRKGNRDTN